MKDTTLLRKNMGVNETMSYVTVSKEELLAILENYASVLRFILNDGDVKTMPKDKLLDTLSIVERSIGTIDNV